MGSEKFDFLGHLVEHVSDLPQMTEEEMQKARAAAAAPPKKRKVTDGESKAKKPRAKKKGKGAEDILEQIQDESIIEISKSAGQVTEEAIVESVGSQELPSFSKRLESDDEDQWNDEDDE